MKLDSTKDVTDITILVAEDHLINFTYLKALLEDQKYKIIHAKNGKQAVDMVLGDNSIDLILMDVGMPVMDGLEATKKIRETNNTIPIIAVTGYAMYEDVQNALDAGCNEYLPKPIPEKALFDILDKHIKKDKE